MTVSYYQVKTSSNGITIDSAIEKGWISKLYAQLSRPEGWSVKELGMTTNTPLKVSYNTSSKPGSEKKSKSTKCCTKNLNSSRTSFHESIQNLNMQIIIATEP